MSIRELQEQVDALAQAVKQYCSNRSCSCCQGPHNGENCPNFFNQPPQHRMETYSCEYCGGILHPGFDCHAGNTLVCDQGPCYNQDFGFNQPSFYSPSQPQQFNCCEFCGGPHYSNDCQARNMPIYDHGPCPHYSYDCQTRNQFVYEPNPGNNYDFPCFDQPPQYHIDQSPPQDLVFDSLMHTCRENNNILEEMLRTQMPNSPVVLKETEGSDDYTEVTYDKEQCLSDHYTDPTTPPAYTPSKPFLATMEPTNTLLMGDEVISTIPIKEINEFIKSSVDDLVPIPRESEVTYDSNLECDMPATAPLPPLMLGKKILISIRL
ncbi:hypothetical protein Tco_0506773 [Tanacetum coccineum]